MARDLIDDRLLGALHLRALDRAGFDHDRATEHTAFQVGTLDALMAGRFDGDATIGELLAHDDLHVELPAGVDLGTPGVADRAAIARVEGGASLAGGRSGRGSLFRTIDMAPTSAA